MNHTHVGAIEGVGEENLPPGSRRLVGLVLRDEDGAVEVRLDRDDGKGRDGDRGVRVGNSVRFSFMSALKPAENRDKRTRR